jgi:predicted dehydrogenase
MRAAIIGIGAIAKMHARALRDIPGVQLVAATCRTEEKGRAFATEFGCQWHADTARMLRREKPDFVTVATPSGAHLPAVITALRRGVHVICEKPLEITLPRIDRMVAAAERSDAMLGAIFPQRFNPVVQTVHAAAAAGRFGTLAVAVKAEEKGSKARVRGDRDKGARSKLCRVVRCAQRRVDATHVRVVGGAKRR